jgi:hypothetical protein
MNKSMLAAFGITMVILAAVAIAAATSTKTVTWDAVYKEKLADAGMGLSYTLSAMSCDGLTCTAEILDGKKKQVANITVQQGYSAYKTDKDCVKSKGSNCTGRVVGITTVQLSTAELERARDDAFKKKLLELAEAKITETEKDKNKGTKLNETVVTIV